jgi:hypothetical protein
VPPRLSRKRRSAVWGLIVLASIIGVISILASWVNQQVLDDAEWQATSERIIQNPEVADALSVYVVDQLYSSVDLGAELRQQLPPNLQPLAGPATAALRQPLTDGVRRLLDQPRVQQFVIDANVLAHRKLVNVVENKTGYGISTGDGVVTVDVGELVGQVGRELGVPSAALDKLPPDAGQFTVMRSDELSLAQTGVQVIRVFDVWLAPLVLLLFGLAIYLARGFRREALRNVGWAFVLVGLVVLVFRRLGGNSVVDALVAAPNRDVMYEVWLTASSILGTIGRSIVFYGVFGVLAASLAGPTRAGTAIRRWIAPVLNRRPGLTWGVAGALYLLLILTGITKELRQPVWILILGAILAGGLVALRRQTLREFPDAQPGGFTTSLRSLRRSSAPSAAAVVAPGPDSTAAQEIGRLAELHEAGVITDDEFDRGKAHALA